MAGNPFLVRVELALRAQIMLVIKTPAGS